MGVADRHQYDARFREGFPSPAQWRWVAGIVAAVAIALLAFWLGRTSAPISKATPQTQPVTVPASGASRTENGVPVGYQQSQPGAIAAATNFTQFLGGPLFLQPDKYRAGLGTLAAPEAKDKLLKEAEGNAASQQNSTQIITNASRGVPVSIGAYPLAYHVNNYSPAVSEISVWYVALLGEDGQLAPSQVWATVTVDLEWTNGDWKVTSDGTTDGPVPVLTQAPVQTKQLPPQLHNYKLYSYAPGA
jgi:hypothetical protein